MGTRIEYENWTGVITEQQALISDSSYDKIFYTNDIRERMESYFKDGRLYHVTHYLKSEDNEADLVASFTEEYNTFSMVKRTITGPYVVEREREYRNGVLDSETEEVILEGQPEPICTHDIYNINGFEPDVVTRFKQFHLEGTNHTYHFYYNEDGSFKEGGLIQEDLFGDEVTEYENFEDIGFPGDQYMPIKKEYFLTDAIDPTGYEPN